MKGKFVNICMALLNLIIGAVIVIYCLMVPSQITDLTIQEYKIVHIVQIAIAIVFGICFILNVVNIFLNSKNSARKLGYFFAACSVSFIFFKFFGIAIFSFLSFFIILISTLKIRWVELNSFTAISFIVILGICLGVIIGACFVYKDLGAYVLEKENKNEQSYKEDYFKYITELDEDSVPYANVKKDGKYGYINAAGETVIDFKYDYASPFVSITAFDKHFNVALVCVGERSLIILKNERIVLTYRSKSMNEDYDGKIEELKDVYYNTLKQTGDMKYEVSIDEANGIIKIPKSEETSDSYTYKFDLNENYDLLITKSSMGLGDRYDLAYKDDNTIRINLDCENLDYDDKYLYVFSNGTIPFYDTSKNQQGWFTDYGRKVTLSGKAQILNFFGDYTLIKNHNDNTVYFINENGDIVSDTYREIYTVNEDRFIVKNLDNKYMVINLAFEKVFDDEWDFADPSLAQVGMYIFGKVNGVIEFSDFGYADNLNLQVLNENGDVILDNLTQVYSKTYKISDDTSISYSERYSNFLSNLKSMNVKFVGDKFYK